MLKVTVHNWGDVAILRCHGRIVVGAENTILRTAVLSQRGSGTLVLDLAQVDCIDAGGLGVLLGLRAWARSNGNQLKLMNVINRVKQVLELTKLDGVFEICSVEDMFHPLHRLPQAVWSDRSP